MSSDYTNPSPRTLTDESRELDELNKYKWPTIIVCLGIVGAIFTFILMLHVNTRHLEAEFNGNSRMQINTFRDWLSLNVNEVEKLSRFLGATSVSSEERLFHTLVSKTIERKVFSGIYLVGAWDGTGRGLHIIAADTRRSDPDDLLLQAALKAEIVNSIHNQEPNATNPITFAGDADKSSKIAIIFPVMRGNRTREAVVALLDPGMWFNIMQYEEGFAISSKYIFNLRADGSEQVFYGDPTAFIHRAFLRYKFSDSEILENTSAFSYTETIPVFSRQWKIVFVATDDYIAKANPSAPWIVMAACLALTGMTGAFLFHLIGLNVRTEDMVRERTKELLETTNELKVAKEAAEAASKAKSDFLSTISHEIRTPLSSIIGLTELLLETELTLQQERNLRTMFSSGEILLELINDMLDFSKIESGKLELDPIPFDLQAAIEDTIELFVPKTQEKEEDLELLMRFAPGTPRFVIGDATRIRQILSNLISNAVKFTQGGYILVTAEKLDDIASGDVANIRISVQDTGIGIPPGMLNAIFEKFTQADASTTRKFGGTGLGLAICRQLARMMQGEVVARSVQGKGSTFSFTMVLWLDPQSQEKEQNVADHALLKGKNALVLDNVEPSRLILSEILTSVGVTARCSGNLQEALGILADAQKTGTAFDMLVTDYIQPETDSELFTRHVKELYPDMPVIMVTAMAEKGYAQIFASSGCDAYLTKPVRKAQFINILEAIFSARKSGKVLSMLTPAAVFFKKDTSRKTGDSEFLRGAEILLVDDNRPNRDLGIKLLENFACRPTAVCNGEEAVEIVTKRTFDLILMDCQMPEMDGFEASSILRGMKQRGEIANIPIIALTANAMKGDKERCLEAGMNDYLIKPLRKTTLLNALMEWLPPVEKRFSANNTDTAKAG